MHHRRKPYWERLDTSERKTLFPAENKGGYKEFKNKPIDIYRGPQINACLWHSSPVRVLLKVSHVASDTGGLKEIVDVISSIYSRLADEPDYRPEPNLKGSRGILQILRHLPWHIYPRILLNNLRDTLSRRGLPANHTLFREYGPPASPEFVTRFLPMDRVERIVEYGHGRNAKLNDLMLAALLRALVTVTDWDRETPLRLVSTIDLRRYVPSGKGEGICNLSAVEFNNFGTDPGDDFASTTDLVTTLTRGRKENLFGLGELLSIRRYIFNLLPYALLKSAAPKVVKREIDKRTIPDVLTNMGSIDPESVTFDARPTNAWFLPPPLYPPAFCVGLSGYAGTLTLSAGVYSEQKATVERFFDSVLAELPS